MGHPNVKKMKLSIIKTKTYILIIFIRCQEFFDSTELMRGKVVPLEETL